MAVLTQRNNYFTFELSIFERFFILGIQLQGRDENLKQKYPNEKKSRTRLHLIR